LKPGDLVRIQYVNWDKAFLSGKIGVLVERPENGARMWWVLIEQKVLVFWDNELTPAYLE
jgi:hypothetical protein